MATRLSIGFMVQIQCGQCRRSATVRYPHDIVAFSLERFYAGVREAGWDIRLQASTHVCVCPACMLVEPLPAEPVDFTRVLR